MSCQWSLSEPLKISEKQRFPDVFKGYRKTQVVWNELNLTTGVKITSKRFDEPLS